ncbi:right-handed parallel beta-helix repeat-containing protein [Halorussus salinisoli]|uniref:right-handed parallel beta-helix repeat-containing protein n=1 Tax=Halorussus salinisoli TaxID=2558242 RepID=UPI0010C2303D|nr:right-handed parallel beta-helix repeat-containing protein [Halorussus salinisoli]
MFRIDARNERNNRFRALSTVLVVLVLLVASAPVWGTTTGADRAGHQQATVIDSCTTIDKPGTYRLTESIENSTADICIEIRAIDVHFDGGGHTVDGNISRQEMLDALRGPPPETGIGVGVHPDGSALLLNVTISNVTVTDWFRGIGARETSGVVVRDVTATATGAGVDLVSAPGSTVVNATTSGNVLVGVLASGSSGSTIRDVTASANGFLGVHVVDSFDSSIRRVAANDNGFSGIDLRNSSQSTVRTVTATGNGFRGLGVVDEPVGNVVENVTVADGNFNRNGYSGIVVFLATNSTFSNVSVVGTTGTLPPGSRSPGRPPAGIHIEVGSGNTFADVDARHQAAWAYHSEMGATNTVEELRTDAGVVSFEARDVALGPTTTLPPDADNATTATPIIEGVTVTNTSADSFIDLEIAWESVKSENQSANETAGGESL